MDNSSKGTSDNDVETSGLLNTSTNSVGDNAQGENAGNIERRNRKKTSEVWQYFTLHPPTDGTREQISVCNHCGHQIRYISANGTGGLRSHITRCSALNGALMLGEINPDVAEDRKKFLKPSSLSIPTPTAAASRKRNSSAFEEPSFSVTTDQSKFKTTLTELLLRENLPFSFTQSTGFKQFLKGIAPGNYNELLNQIPASHEFEAEVHSIFENFLHALQPNIDFIYMNQIAVTLLVNIYETNRPFKLLTIGIQYINRDWELENYLVGIKSIDAVSIDQINAEKVASQILECIEGLKLTENIFFAVFDYAATTLGVDKRFWKLFFKTLQQKPTIATSATTPGANRAAASSSTPLSLAQLLQKNKLALLASYFPNLNEDDEDIPVGGDFDRVGDNLPPVSSFLGKHSFPFFMSKIAVDALDQIRPVVNKLRTHFTRTKSFLEQKEGGDDLETNWKSTVDMIHYGVLNKAAITTAQKEVGGADVISSEEWKHLESSDKLFTAICLAIDHCIPATANTFSVPANNHLVIPTAQLLFSDLCDVNLELSSRSKDKRHHTSTNNHRDLFGGQLDSVLPRLAISLILDPSCKAEFIAETISEEKANYFVEKMHKLFQEAYYSQSNDLLENTSSLVAATPTINKSEWTHDSRESFLKRRKLNQESSTNTTTTSSNNGTTSSSSSSNPIAAGLTVNTSTNAITGGDLDFYLKEPLQILPNAATNPFAILHWWKANASRFPSLARMARDFLSIPVSALSNELVYRHAQVCQELPEHLRSLPFTMLKKILLCRSWLNRSTKVNN